MAEVAIDKVSTTTAIETLDAGNTTMAAQRSQIGNFNLTLDEVERWELRHALEQCVTGTHDERCHADSAQYHDQLAGDELRLRTLLDKVRRLAF
jgi:hypothetical protein